MCKLFILILYIWCIFNVFQCFPFLCVLIMSNYLLRLHMHTSRVYYVASVSRITVIIYNCLYIFLVSGVECSVCLTYFSGQSKHFIWWMPLL
jgi:hypothetical protein